MSIGEIIALVGVCIVAVGLIATWRKNGREQVARDVNQAEKLATWKQEIQGSVDHIEEELKSNDHGLIALAQGQANFRTHCASVSTSLIGKVESNTRAIEELKRRGK